MEGDLHFTEFRVVTLGALVTGNQEQVARDADFGIQHIQAAWPRRLGCGITCGSLLGGGGRRGTNGRQLVQDCVGGRPAGRESGAMGRSDSTHPTLETQERSSKGIDGRVAARGPGSDVDGSRRADSGLE